MNSGKILFRVLLAGSIVLSPIHSRLLAQSETTNPLEIGIDTSDPVIPLGYKKRELSTFEINRIKREMDRLDLSAKKELKQGKVARAFKLWYRQLKLARAVSIQAEIEALGKVGAIAWQENQGQDLRNIANRLTAIESKIGIDKLSSEQLKQLSDAYQQVRYLDRAIAIYEQILANNKQQGSLAALKSSQETLGELYLANFNYQKAANTYQKLLEKALIKSPTDKEIGFYQQTLGDIYDRTGQTKQALEIKTALIKTYKATGKLERLAPLELSLARDYKTVKQTKAAIESYNRAFKLASENEQLAVANDALSGLGELYQQKGETEKAIATLTELLKIQRQSYNDYGLINTYSKLGRIHLKSAQKQRAKLYFQQALELARELDYNVDYFNDQIEKLQSFQIKIRRC